MYKISTLSQKIYDNFKRGEILWIGYAACHCNVLEKRSEKCNADLNQLRFGWLHATFFPMTTIAVPSRDTTKWTIPGFAKSTCYSRLRSKI